MRNSGIRRGPEEAAVVPVAATLLLIQTKCSCRNSQDNKTYQTADQHRSIPYGSRQSEWVDGQLSATCLHFYHSQPLTGRLKIVYTEIWAYCRRPTDVAS